MTNEEIIEEYKQSIWHPAHEVPKVTKEEVSKRILLESKFDNCDCKGYYTTMYFAHESWLETLDRYENVYRWCYVDDLLPKCQELNKELKELK